MQENTLTYEQLINLFERTDRKIELLTEENRKTEKQIKELGIQIGGISNKFGTFTEGLVYPSIEKELYEHSSIISV